MISNLISKQEYVGSQVYTKNAWKTNLKCKIIKAKVCAYICTFMFTYKFSGKKTFYVACVKRQNYLVDSHVGASKLLLFYTGHKKCSFSPEILFVNIEKRSFF
jgi:hypothetical protein